jgi:hypothetical protein
MPSKTPTLVNPVLPTPAPVPELNTTLSNCDAATTVTKYAPYCKQPDRNLTVWVKPGMENQRCVGSSTVFNVETFKSCVEYCAVNQGGPPRCSFISYDPKSLQCRWSPTCHNTTEVERGDIEEVEEADGTYIHSGVNQLFCSFRQTLLDVCYDTDRIWHDPSAASNPGHAYYGGGNWWDPWVQDDDEGFWVKFEAHKNQTVMLTDDDLHDDSTTANAFTHHLVPYPIVKDLSQLSPKLRNHPNASHILDLIYLHSPEGEEAQELMEQGMGERAAHDIIKRHEEEFDADIENEEELLEKLAESTGNGEVVTAQGTQTAIFQEDEPTSSMPANPSQKQLELMGETAIFLANADGDKALANTDSNADIKAVATVIAQGIAEGHSRRRLHVDLKAACANGMGGKTAYGSPCIFPFIYKNNTYTACTTVDMKDMEWCATEVDDDSLIAVQGSWGACIDCVEDDDFDNQFGYYDVTEEHTVHEIVEYPTLYETPGLSECYDDCERINGCNVYAFSADLMMCMLLGDDSIKGLESGCTLLLLYSSQEDKVVSQLADMGYSGQPFEQGKPIPQWIKDIGSTFRVYVINDVPWVLFGQEKQEVQCVCIDGYVLDPSNNYQCVPALGTNSSNPSQCTQLKVHGAINAAGNDDDHATFVATGDEGATNYDACEIFLDCNLNGNKDPDEKSCSLNNMECVVDKPINELYLCPAMLDPAMQPAGYSCGIARHSPGIMTVNTELIDQGAKDSTGICLGMVNHRDNSAVWDTMFKEVPAHIINGTTADEYVFDPGEHEDPSNPSYPLMGWCNLCWKYGCGEIEEIVFNTDLAEISSKNVNWDRNTYADTIAACMPCTAPSEDPNVCSFKDAEVQAEQWPVCDNLCIYNDCEKLKYEIEEKLVELHCVPEVMIGSTSQRILTPLCWACDYDIHKCVSKPVDYDPNVKSIVSGCDICANTNGGTFMPESIAGFKCFDHAGDEIENDVARISAEMCTANGGVRAEPQQCGMIKSFLDSMNICPEEYQQNLSPNCCENSVTIDTPTAEEVNDIIESLSKSQAMIMNMMTKDQQREFVMAPGDVQVANVGFSLPPTPAPKSGGGNDADIEREKLITSLPPANQMVLSMMTSEQKDGFFTASGEVQLANAGFSLPPTPQPTPALISTDVFDTLSEDQQGIMDLMSSDQQQQFLASSPNDQMSALGFSLPPTPAPAALDKPEDGMAALIMSLPRDQQVIFGMMSPSQQVGFISAPGTVQMSRAGFSLPPTPAPPTPAATDKPEDGFSALIMALPPDQQAIIGMMSPAQQAGFLQADGATQMAGAGFSLPPSPAPPEWGSDHDDEETPATSIALTPIAAAASAAPDGMDAKAIGAIVSKLPPDQQAIFGAMSPEQQVAFLQADGVTQMAGAGFSLPPTPAPATPAPPTPAATDKPEDGFSALIMALPPDQQAIIGMMSPAQQQQFAQAPPAMQVQSAGFSLPPTPATAALLTNHPTTAPPTAAHSGPTPAPTKTSVESLVASLPADQQGTAAAALTSMKPAQLTQFLELPPDMQLSAAGFSFPPTPATPTPPPTKAPTSGTPTNAPTTLAPTPQLVTADPQVMMAIITQLPPMQQADVASMTSQEREEFFGASASKQIDLAGWSLPPTASPASGPVTAEARLKTTGEKDKDSEVEEGGGSKWVVVIGALMGGVVVIGSLLKFVGTVRSSMSGVGRGGNVGSSYTMNALHAPTSPDKTVTIVMNGDLRDIDTMCLTPGDHRGLDLL